jgi:uncharacterized membrane protein
MADDEDEGTETEAAPAGLSDADVTKVAAAVAAILQPAHATAQTAVQDRLAAPGDAPQDVAAIVRAELARTDAQAADAKVRADVETHAQILAKLQEPPPRPPVTRRHRFMGWGD